MVMPTFAKSPQFNLLAWNRRCWERCW